MTQQIMKIKENINHLRMNALRKPDSLTNWRRNRPSLFPSILRGVLLKIMYVMILKWIREHDVKYKSPRIAVSLVCCSKTWMAFRNQTWFHKFLFIYFI